MRIEATLENREQHHAVAVATEGAVHELAIAPHQGCRGSSGNGGELLCLALTTCYCNDIYREAKAHSIQVIRVEVNASAEFGGQGEPAKSLAYRARGWKSDSK